MTLVAAQPAIQVSKRLVEPFEQQAAGDLLHFEIVVHNAGNATLTTVPVTDTFAQACYSFVSAQPDPDSVTAATGQLVWNNVGPLTQGQRRLSGSTYTPQSGLRPGAKQRPRLRAQRRRRDGERPGQRAALHRPAPRLPAGDPQESAANAHPHASHAHADSQRHAAGGLRRAADQWQFRSRRPGPLGPDEDARLGPGRNSAYGGWVGGKDNAAGEIYQAVQYPAGASSATLTFWWRAEPALLTLRTKSG